MGDALLSDADVGLAPATAPATTSTMDALSDAARPLTVRPTAAPPAQPALMSDADVGLAPADASAAAAQGSGPLANTQDDGWLSGAAKGAATGIIKGAAHVPGWVGDVHDLSRFLAAGAASLFDSRSASDIYKSMKDRDAAYDASRPAWAPPSPASVLPLAGDVAAPILARTGDYQPTSETGRMAQAGVEAAAGGIGPGAGALTKGAKLGATLLSTLRQAPLNAIAGTAGQGATDATGNPYLGLAASLIAPTVTEAAGKVGAKVMSPAIEDVPVIGRAFPGQREINVGNDLLHASSMPDKLSDFARTGAVPDGDAATLPGPSPTTGAVLGDAGLLGKQRELLRNPDAGLLQHAEDQNAAQVAGIKSLASGDADDMLPSRFLADRAALIDQAEARAQARILRHAQDLAASLGPGQGAEVNGASVRSALDRIDAASAATDAANVGQARGAAASLGVGTPPELNGTTILTAQEAAKAQARRLRSSLYAPETLDPEGKINLVMTPAKDAGRGVSADIDPLGDPAGADVSRILGQMNALPDVLPYKSVMALDQNITAAMAKERRANGESPDWSRLSRLKSGLMSTINDALDNQHAHEQSAVATGRMTPDDMMMSKLRGAWAEGYDTAGSASDGLRTAARAGTRVEGSGTGAQSGFSAASDPLREAGRESPQAPRDPGVSAQARSGSGVDDVRFDVPAYDPDASSFRAPVRPSVPRPQSLHDFVRTRGGMTDPGGDLAAMGLHKLIGKDGRAVDPDKMREAAAEAGYLGGDTEAAMRETTPTDLMNALEDGHRTYSVRDHDAVLAWDQHDQARGVYDQMRGGDSPLREAGMRPKAPLSSYGVDDIYAPGTAPSPANGGLRPYVDEGFADRVAKAKAAHADYDQTFKKGVVGEDLRTTGFSGQYRTGAGALAGKVLPAGPGGYEIMKARLASVRNDPAALAAVQDQALAPLRAKLDDGMLPQSVIDGWRAKHDGALRALDEAVPGFARRYDAAGAAHTAVTEARAAADATNVTRRFDGTPAQTITRAIKAGPEGYERLKALFDATGRDSAVIGAVKDQIVDPLRRGLLHDATVAPRAHASWISSHGPALRALDEVSPGFSKQFADAAAATEVLTRAGAVRERLADARRADAATRLIGKTDSIEAQNEILGMIRDGKSGPTQLRQLMKATEGRSEVQDGIRKLARDGLLREMQNTSEAGLSGDKKVSNDRVAKLLRDRRAALAEVFPEDALNRLGMVARSLELNNRDITAGTIKASAADRARDIGHALGDKLSHSSAAHAGIGAVLGEQLLEHLHNPAMLATAGAGAAALYGLNRLRSGGQRVQDVMYHDAIKNPLLAQRYVSRALDAKDLDARARVLAGILRRQLISAPVVKQAYGE